MNIKPSFHGSDLEQIETYYGIAKEEMISFGANVNPLGISSKVTEALKQRLDVITRYPDRDYKDLRNVIAAYCHTDSSYVAVGNGSTELISLLISSRMPKKAFVLGPTYSEYGRELKLSGAKTRQYLLKESLDFRLDVNDFLAQMPDDTDLVIICNPNNPTSSALTLEEMRKIVSECAKHDIFVMVDETYAELAPSLDEVSSIPLATDYENLMILRGVSKFFAAPGLRLGYGITSSQDFLNTLRERQIPWSLNSFGALAGELMLADHDHIRRTKELISSERERMIKEISTWKCAKLYPAYGNFLFLKICEQNLSSFDVFEYLIRKKLMIRDCSSFDGLDGEFIRFCVMNPEDNDRLLYYLKELLG